MLLEGLVHFIKINGIMRKQHYVDILKQNLKTSARKLGLCPKWVFQIDNDHKHTAKVVEKWLRDKKEKRKKRVGITKP